MQAPVPGHRVSVRLPGRELIGFVTHADAESFTVLDRRGAEHVVALSEVVAWRAVGVSLGRDPLAFPRALLDGLAARADVSGTAWVCRISALLEGRTPPTAVPEWGELARFPAVAPDQPQTHAAPDRPQTPTAPDQPPTPTAPDQPQTPTHAAPDQTPTPTDAENEPEPPARPEGGTTIPARFEGEWVTLGCAPVEVCVAAAWWATRMGARSIQVRCDDPTLTAALAAAGFTRHPVEGLG